MIRVILNGAGGRMGRVLRQLIEEDDRFEYAAGADVAGGTDIYTSLGDDMPRADVIIDFSHPTAADNVTDFAVARGIPAVIATTGYTETELGYLRRAAQHIPVFYSGNMSLGVALLCDMAKKAASAAADSA